MSKSFLSSIGNFTALPHNTTFYYPLHGIAEYGGSINTSVAIYGKIHSLILHNLQIDVGSNTLTVSATCTVRIVSTNSSIEIIYTTGETGKKTDLDNQEAITDTDYFYMNCTAPVGAGSIDFSQFYIEFNTDNIYAHSLLAMRARQITFITVISGNGDFYGTNGTYSKTGAGTYPSQYLTNTEVYAKTKLYSSYTCGNLTANIATNARANNSTFYVRKNSAAGNQSLVYTAGETGIKEDVDTDSFTNGDYINFHVNLNNTGDANGIACRRIQTTLYETTQKRFLCICSDVNGYALAGTTDYPLQSALGDSVSTITTQFNMTFINMTTYVATNTTTANSTFVLEQNNADTTLKITYATLETGEKVDTDSVSINVGDTLNYSATEGTGGNISPRLHYSEVNTPIHWKPQTIFVNYG